MDLARRFEPVRALRRGLEVALSLRPGGWLGSRVVDHLGRTRHRRRSLVEELRARALERVPLALRVGEHVAEETHVDVQQIDAALQEGRVDVAGVVQLGREHDDVLQIQALHTLFPVLFLCERGRFLVYAALGVRVDLLGEVRGHHDRFGAIQRARWPDEVDFDAFSDAFVHERR